MKTKILKLTILFLLPVVLGAGCDKEDDGWEEIPVEPYEIDCDRELEFIKSLTRENILLFDSLKMSYDEMKDLSYEDEKSEFVSFNPVSGNALLFNIHYSKSSHVPIGIGRGYISNMPEAAKKWIIPNSGLYISLKAEEYKPCEEYYSIGMKTYSLLVLKSLNKKTSM